MPGVRVLPAVVLFGIAACVRPIRLDLSVPQVREVTVSTRLTKGDKVATPDTCELPCGMMVAPGTTHELTLKAPGYYPAVMQVTYDQLLPVSGDNAAQLVVPLVERPPRPVVIPTPATDAEAAPAAP